MTTEAPPKTDEDTEPQPEPDDQPSIVNAAIDEVVQTYTGHKNGIGSLSFKDDYENAVFTQILRVEAPKVAKRIQRERMRATFDPDKGIGIRTLGALPTGPRPDQLLDPFLSPEGPTILYGPGGVGKGMIATWWAICLVRNGHIVMVIDYEHNEHEWGRRARAMGATDEELARIHYRAPFSDEWTATRGALIEVAEYLKADCDRLKVTYLIIDSYVMATTTGDSMGGQASAQEFYTGIATIGRRCLVLAHVTGAAEKFPARPFGSVYVHNLARETWAAGSATDLDFDIPFDPKTIHLQPTILAVELRNKKMNDGPEASNQFIVFAFYPDGTIEVSSPQPKKGTIGDWAVDILTRAGKEMTGKALIAAIKEDKGEDVKDPSLRTALNRDKRIKTSNSVPRLYGLTATTDETD